MGWASEYINKLKLGENSVSFRPRGNSMTPRIKSGELVTVVQPIDISVGDVVLCKVKGREYLHLVSSINGDRYQISNNHGFVNGWISRNSIFGKLVENLNRETK